MAAFSRCSAVSAPSVVRSRVTLLEVVRLRKPVRPPGVLEIVRDSGGVR